MFNYQVVNPFTGENTPRTIQIREIVEADQFEALKDFIRQHLNVALSNLQEQKSACPTKIQALENLIVQLYQPGNFLGLTSKLLKFNEHLFDVPQFNEIINHLKGIK